MTDNKIQKPLPKYYFDIVVEGTVPVILTFKVLTETPEQALEMYQKQKNFLAPSDVKYKLTHRKDKKLTIKNAGSMVVRLVKNLFS